MAALPECFISVDVETAGPIPGEYSMLALGACLVETPSDGFYAEFQPLNGNAVPESLRVSGLDLAKLAASGERPEVALARFRDWVQHVAGAARPVFVGFNAGFDWSFVNWYCVRFLGANPFGFAALDIKSYYMGLTGCAWDDTRSSRIPAEFQPDQPGDHHALNDARAQAAMFAKLRAARRS